MCWQKFRFLYQFILRLRVFVALIEAIVFWFRVEHSEQLISLLAWPLQIKFVVFLSKCVIDTDLFVVFMLIAAIFIIKRSSSKQSPRVWLTSPAFASWFASNRCSLRSKVPIDGKANKTLSQTWLTLMPWISLRKPATRFYLASFLLPLGIKWPVVNELFVEFYNCGLNDREVEWQQQRLWSGTMELNSLFNGSILGQLLRRSATW